MGAFSRYVRNPPSGNIPGMGRIAFYVLACAAFGASAGFVLWWVGVPVAGASLLGVVAACVLALVLVLAAALQGRW